MAPTLFVMTDRKRGDEETKSKYEFRDTDFDPKHFWASQQRSLQWIAEQSREAAQAKAERSRYHLNSLNASPQIKQEMGNNVANKIDAECTKNGDPMEIDPRPRHEPELHNIYEGEEMAKQLNEPLADFLNRLKPSTTPISSGPWIWIANPYSKRPGKSDILGFKQEGHRLLENFASQRRLMEAKHPEKNAGSITRLMNPARDLLEEDIVKLARARHLMNGKWMLFPSPSHVDEVWAKVARATVAGELGVAAKVATSGDDERSEKTRLVCVYTDDFSNKEDVKRVLKKLRDLKLIGGDQGIFYKCDAYTYLDIMNGNQYKLKASMYGSKEMLKDG